MKIEHLHEAYDLSKARIEHPEDLVLTAGSQGASLAITLLHDAVKNPGKMSFKPDGKPAIMWGMDDKGFAMGDKYMNPLPHSIKELMEIIAGRGTEGREDLIAMYKELWPVFQSSVKDVDGYLFGDLLYRKTPPVRSGNYVIKPNTVEYTVPFSSALGKKVGQSKAGIVVHTLVNPRTRNGKHIDDITKVKGVVANSDLLMISDSLPQQVTIIEPNLKKLQTALSGKAKEIDAFLNQNALSEKKIKALPELLKKYVNVRVKSRSFDNMPNGFITWLDTNASKPMAAKIKQHIVENRLGYSAMWNVFVLIASAKNFIVDQLDKLEGELTPSIEGVPGNEGYIVHSSKGPVKLVNRFKFSAAHFNH